MCSSDADTPRKRPRGSVAQAVAPLELSEPPHRRDGAEERDVDRVRGDALAEEADGVGGGVAVHTADAPPRGVAGPAHVLVADVRAEPPSSHGRVPEDAAVAARAVPGVDADADAAALGLDQAQQLRLEVAGAEEAGGDHRRRPRLELQQVQQQREGGDHGVSSGCGSPSAMHARYSGSSSFMSTSRSAAGRFEKSALPSSL